MSTETSLRVEQVNLSYGSTSGAMCVVAGRMHPFLQAQAPPGTVGFGRNMFEESDTVVASDLRIILDANALLTLAPSPVQQITGTQVNPSEFGHWCLRVVGNDAPLVVPGFGVGKQFPKVSYLTRGQIESTLGTIGQVVLRKVVELTRNIASERDWPLNRVDVRYVQDPEVEDWKYVLLLLVFSCDFDIADQHLHELYDHLDTLAGKMSSQEESLYQQMFFFDVETSKNVFAS